MTNFIFSVHSDYTLIDRCIKDSIRQVSSRKSIPVALLPKGKNEVDYMDIKSVNGPDSLEVFSNEDQTGTAHLILVFDLDFMKPGSICKRLSLFEKVRANSAEKYRKISYVLVSTPETKKEADLELPWELPWIAKPFNISQLNSVFGHLLY
ncbi:hypothetical protein M9194_11630 [Vibrio sp. S4M6]|uniref:hypothetical protein n=1 Tax=Vibrio sinus TaxID=2946865 RepID=UPI00202AB27D|nr:hypothetical protein [Vibrio sinus]MCL9782077.1 hypothetical protein [Vibrio sinus]